MKAHKSITYETGIKIKLAHQYMMHLVILKSVEETEN